MYSPDKMMFDWLPRIYSLFQFRVNEFLIDFLEYENMIYGE